MKGVACRFAIVQFLPYSETGEFANVGVVLSCPQMRFLGVKMAPSNRTKRITNFFTELDARTYRAAIRLVRDDYQRLAADVQQGWMPADVAFAEITRPRETMIRCSHTRAVLATKHPEETLLELYNRFIERDFATKEYREAQLEKLVAQTLDRASLRDLYKADRIGDKDFNVAFPFVHGEAGKNSIVIKPLHLAHDEASKILDHGIHWIGRLDRLKRHNSLPRQVLFAVDTAHSGRAEAAAKEVVHDLRRLGVHVVEASDHASIVGFADQARLM